MPLYLVERHLPGLTPDGLVSAVERAKAASAEMVHGGIPIHHLRSTLLPAEERCICLFEGPSREAVMTANDRANIPYRRVVEAMSPDAQEIGQRYSFSSVAERPDFVPVLSEADAAAYPAYMLRSDLASLLPAVYREFPEYQLVLCDDFTDMHLAHGNMVPFAWDGTYEGLPKTAADMVRLALEHKHSGVRPNVLGALQVVVDPTQQGKGLSARMLQGMANVAAAHGFSDLFAPIRPSQKERYPLTTLDRYASWTRADGLPVDPWQRTHARMGATPAGPIDEWLTVSATVGEWTRWTGMVFPESGSYVIPGGLVPLEIDLGRGMGSYREPHLWMHHRIVSLSATSGSASRTLTFLADSTTAVETVPVAAPLPARVPVPAARRSRYVACRYV